jgi:hypothetical protein
MKNAGVLPSVNAEVKGASVGAAFWSQDASGGATGKVSPKEIIWRGLFCLHFMMMDFFFNKAVEVYK